MNRLKTSEIGRLRRGMSILALGFVGLTACSGGDYKQTEHFAQCNFDELKDRQPVVLDAEPIADVHDIPALRRAIVTSPQTLIDTAKRLKSESSDQSISVNMQDTHHGQNIKWFDDYLDNPGDVLCEVTPLGGNGKGERSVYYDQDGINLLHAVDKALASQFQTTN